MDVVQNKRMARTLLWILLAFFGVMLVANFFLVKLATQSWNGLVTEQPYEKGLAYNQTLAQREQEARLGWTVTMQEQKLKPLTYALQVKVVDSADQFLQNATVVAEIKRPTHEGFDKTVELVEKDGFYTAEVEFPLVGQWDVFLRINDEAETFQTYRRMNLIP